MRKVQFQRGLTASLRASVQLEPAGGSTSEAWISALPETGIGRAPQAVQKAIDKVGRAGDGTVFVPPKKYLCDTIFLRSRIALRLATGATMLSSTSAAGQAVHRPTLLPYTDNNVTQALISEEGLDQVGTVGRGTIDVQGHAFARKEYPCRLYGIRLVSCRNVRVSDCLIFSNDDAPVLRGTTGIVTDDVGITNCILGSLCNTLKRNTGVAIRKTQSSILFRLYDESGVMVEEFRKRKESKGH